ncbi:MAG: ABC transporter ATP-binding protein [Candidatus Liptonbacteria bacterium]|nr:ABC transporter ATP-binding protein [Candidatus Liptonbacteria bacterium]
MEEEARDERNAPANWREYLHYAKETSEMFRWTWRAIPQESKRRSRVLLLGLLVSIAAKLLLPHFVGVLVDGAANQATSAVSYALAGIAVCLVVTRVFDYVFASTREWILGLNWGAVDRFITEQFFGKSVGQHIQESSRLSVSNIDKGRWKLLDLQAMLLFEGIPSILSLALAYAFLWVFLPAAGAIMTGGIAFYLLWTLYLNRQVMVQCTPLDAEFRKLNRYRVERWEKVERVKTSTRGAEETAHTDNWFNGLIARDRKFWIWYIKQTVWRGGINNVCLITTLSYGAWLVWSGQWSVALLLPLFSWSMQVMENIWQIGHIEHQLNWNAPSVQSMIAALSLPADVRSGPVQISAAKPIEVVFDGVGHSYPAEAHIAKAASAQVIEGVSFRIAPGEKIALLGRSGAGKTTIMRLLLRYMDPSRGMISVQGTNLREADLESWWRAVGYIPQQPQILDGSIRDNLTYALSSEERARMSDAELWELMRLLQIDFGSRLAQGLDTLVGRNGLKLSGGQAQRLMIGAAAVKKPAFMVIDEATSSLDSSTEKLVQRGLAEILKPEVGALVVAHRLSTVRNLCSRFVVLRAADEMAAGDSQVEAIASTFEELYDASPTFRRLADDQGIVIHPRDDAAGMPVLRLAALEGRHMVG